MRIFGCKAVVMAELREGVTAEEAEIDEASLGEAVYEFQITDSLESDGTLDSRDALLAYVEARALDAFHHGNAIGNLDDVDISVVVEMKEEAVG